MKEKIDMVYLWCDGNETEFKKRRQLYSKNVNESSSNEVNGDKRFISNDELKYSLRSLEMYAPWINHVFIVTDRQKPEWLNIRYDKVTVVDHSEIMPKDIIPCFNSDVIEYFLGFIPGLSEYYLFSNDDTYFGRTAKPEDFFLDNKPIVRVKKFSGVLINEEDASNYSYLKTVVNSLELINNTYKKSYKLQLHHNIDAYTRTSYITTYNKFKHELNKYIHNRFRDKDDLQRTLFNIDMICNGRGVMRVVNDPPVWKRHFRFFFKNLWESYVDDDSLKARKEILKYRPLLFCLNGSDYIGDENQNSMKNFLEKLFPVKSRFEL